MGNDDPDDVRAIYEHLLVELRPPGAPLVQTGSPALAELGRQAIVSAGAPDVSTRKLSAPARMVRGMVFRLTRFYVDPLMRQQRAFNLAAVRYIAELERRVAELEDERASERG
jgi:hypothetical protein